MKTLLVPCDGSGSAIRALRHVAAKARDSWVAVEVDLFVMGGRGLGPVASVAPGSVAGRAPGLAWAPLTPVK